MTTLSWRAAMHLQQAADDITNNLQSDTAKKLSAELNAVEKLSAEADTVTGTVQGKTFFSSNMRTKSVLKDATIKELERVAEIAMHMADQMQQQEEQTRKIQSTHARVYALYQDNNMGFKTFNDFLRAVRITDEHIQGVVAVEPPTKKCLDGILPGTVEFKALTKKEQARIYSKISYDKKKKEQQQQNSKTTQPA